MLARRTPSVLSSRRRGTAIVELAVCIPVMVLFVFGSIEVTNSIYLKQALTSTAYEGARLASGAGGTVADAEALCDQLLVARSIEGAEFSCTAITPSTTSGTLITVSLTVSADQNSLGITRFFRNRLLTGAATMPRL